jgi:hypothetical protein
MSYWIEDANGFLSDFATNVGMMDYQRDTELPKSLKQFLDAGEADAELLNAVRGELADNPKYEKIATMLKNAKAPLILTDGCGPAETKGESRADERSAATDRSRRAAAALWGRDYP